MNSSPLVAAIRDRLLQASYRDVPTPLKVAGVDFEFTGAMRGVGGRALDLVILVDTTTGAFGDRDGSRVRQRIEGLSRALDVTGSRLVVTAILAGAALTGGADALAGTCLVLHVEPAGTDGVDGRLHADDAERLEDRIRLLLPLSLPEQPADPDQGGSAMEQLQRYLPVGTDAELVAKLVDASQEGEDAVTTSIGAILDAALTMQMQTVAGEPAGEEELP